MVFAFYRQNDTVSHFKRDVSQITHILEIWDLGGENNIEKKKIRIIYRTCYRKGKF